jgi:hypothetical protein
MRAFARWASLPAGSANSLHGNELMKVSLEVRVAVRWRIIGQGAIVSSHALKKCDSVSRAKSPIEQIFYSAESR